MRTSLRAISPPDAFSRQATSVITLGQVRTGPQVTNDYVDSPSAAQAQHSLKPQLAFVGGGVVVGGGGVSSPGLAHRVILPSRSGSGGNTGSPRQTLTPSPSPVVSQQLLPKSPPLKKEPVISLDASRGGDGPDCANGSAAASAGTNHGDGIICVQCGRCRCAACTEPRPLPSHWCCRGTCEVSPNKVLDVCTCFCCVKGMFYHCGAEEDNECYEKPCGCHSTPHCCSRWTVLGLMALCLPCLWAYWPAKACLTLCTSCYNRCRHKGCQCHLGTPKGGASVLSVTGSIGNSCVSGGTELENHSKNSQTHRLLIESDSSSA